MLNHQLYSKICEFQLKGDVEKGKVVEIFAKGGLWIFSNGKKHTANEMAVQYDI